MIGTAYNNIKIKTMWVTNATMELLLPAHLLLEKLYVIYFIFGQIASTLLQITQDITICEKHIKRALCRILICMVIISCEDIPLQKNNDQHCHLRQHRLVSEEERRCLYSNYPAIPGD